MKAKTKTARLTLIATSLLLVLVPLALLLISWLYELWVINRLEHDLARIAQIVVEHPDGNLAGLGRREGVEIRILSATGNPDADSSSLREALHSSPLVLPLGKRGVSGEGLGDLDEELGPLVEREEVKEALSGRSHFVFRKSSSGQTLVFSLAAPFSGGRAVYVERAERRGLRQLFALRTQLFKLVAYQACAALLLAWVLSRRLIRPLEDLAGGAGRFPDAPLATAELMARDDEIGQLARVLTHLTSSLESRRRQTADLTADLAHELKNPLATIAASAEFLGSTPHASGEKQRMVEAHIRDAVSRLQRTTDGLLALVRLESALPDEPRETLRYADLVNGVLDEYRRDPRHQGFAFILDVESAVGEVRLIREAWVRLLRNLIDNALVQPTSRKEVVVRARRTPEGIVTSVQDFGPGVSAGNRERIFRRFFTLRPVGVPEGTGLGLSIVQAVAAAHGGKVELESQEGAGATFHVAFATQMP